MWCRTTLLAVSLLFSACTVSYGSTRPTLPGLEDRYALARKASTVKMPEHTRGAIAREAAAHVGKSSIPGFRADCSGTIRGIFERAGAAIDDAALAYREGENGVARLYRWLRQAGSLRRADPRVGDLVFFDDTYDKNGDGHRNDPLTHVAVVEKVLDDGTVVMVHRVGAGILRYRMNLAAPRVRREGGRVLNHYLRRAVGDEGPKTTAELFVAFGTAPTPAKPTNLATVFGPTPGTR